MARASAKSPFSLSRLCQVAGMSTVLLLSGCIGKSIFEELDATEPLGSPFSDALFKNYSFLARSFGAQSSPPGQAFDAQGAISITATDNTIAGLAYAYAQKALTAGRGDEVLPETAPEGDADAENVRLELLKDLDEGREKAPDDAARAQADYDCWIMDRRVDSLAAAAQTCRRSVTASLAKLEREINAGQPIAAEEAPETEESPLPAPPPAPPASAPTPAPSASAPVEQAEYTVTFGFHSAKLPLDQYATVGQIIAAARVGHQTHITVVGHSDTAEDSRALSLHRAEAVKAALVQQGARADAITVSGVGKDDLAVQTGDHAKEPKNRRVVVTLVP